MNECECSLLTEASEFRKRVFRTRLINMRVTPEIVGEISKQDMFSSLPASQMMGFGGSMTYSFNRLTVLIELNVFLWMIEVGRIVEGVMRISQFGSITKLI